MDDRAVVAAQLERPPRSPIDVAARCHLQLPVVIAVPPYLDDGTPFPTSYWLTCPLAVLRISRIESAGGVKAAEGRLAADPALAQRYQDTMTRYAADRDELIAADRQGPRPTGGVGGTRFGVKCLHAQYADFAAGNDNVVGEWTSAEVGPLNCATGCVVEIDEVVVPNPNWREPRW
ncbi:MAG: DUF501 domain-containing protein [bacterium]|nr:DUF501 domain-containing protein [bacterium]